MVFITIDERSSTPLYLQIRDQIVSTIVRGELEVGETLPSVRKLAGDLGINLHTVNKAYALLQDEGYVRMLGRAGTVVADRGEADAEQLLALADRTADELNRLALEFSAGGGAEQDFLALAARAVQNVHARKPHASRAPHPEKED